MKDDLKIAEELNQRLRRQIKVGYFAVSDHGEKEMVAILKTVSRKFTDTDILMQKFSLQNMAAYVECGFLDIAISDRDEFSYHSNSSFDWIESRGEGISIYFSNDMVKNLGNICSIDACRNIKILSVSRKISPIYADKIIRLCEKYGFEPDISDCIFTVSDIEEGLKGNRAVFLGRNSLKYSLGSEIRSVEICEETEWMIFWKKNAGSTCRAVAEAFAKEIEKL